jgi:hypothetical protein
MLRGAFLKMHDFKALLCFRVTDIVGVIYQGCPHQTMKSQENHPKQNQTLVLSSFSLFFFSASLTTLLLVCS